MRLRIFAFCFLVIAVSGITSCKKDDNIGLTAIRPAVPVTVANAIDFTPVPVVRGSKAENKISIVLQIPAGTGRTIKEVTKIAAATSANYTTIYSSTTVGTGATQLWSNTPIPVNATTYTFNTTFDEYRTKTGGTATTVYASNALLPTRAFYFMLTLDNGEVIIPEFIRVWVVD
jgi:hypothetical protein